MMTVVSPSPPVSAWASASALEISWVLFAWLLVWVVGVVVGVSCGGAWVFWVVKRWLWWWCLEARK